jgi:hypothetical protein
MSTEMAPAAAPLDPPAAGETSVDRRWQAAIIGAVAAGLLASLRWKYAAWMPSDLDHLWYAARAILSGGNPYDAVGPGKSFDWEWGVFYPLPAILLVLPFTVVPVVVARLAFSVLAGAALGFAMGSRWRSLWPLFLSQAFFLTISRNQWSALILAAVWLPAIGFVIAAKPNIGLIALAAQRRDTVVRVVLLAGLLVILSFIVRPSWLGEWLALVRSAPNKEIALLQPGGFLLLAAVLLWRTMEGRLLLASAAVPQTPSAYDMLLFFALCRTRTQAAFLALLTHLAQFTVLQLGPYANHDAYYDTMAKVVVLVIMLPVLGIVLTNRFANSTTPVSPVVPGRDSALASRTEAALLFLLFLAFLLQCWIIYGQQWFV